MQNSPQASVFIYREKRRRRVFASPIQSGSKKWRGFSKSRLLKGMREIARSCLPKCPQAIVWRCSEKKRSPVLTHPIQFGSESWVAVLCLVCVPEFCTWVVCCPSRGAPRSRSWRKEEREGKGEFGRRGSPVKKFREGKEKEKAGGKKKRKEHLKQPLR